MKQEQVLTVDNMNQRLRRVRYAVRGPVLERALHIEHELEKGVPKPFASVVRANIGDCHALGQKPITFIRQVVAGAACPQLLASPALPPDVKQRVEEILDDCTCRSVGAYSASAGLWSVRRAAAAWLAARDGTPASAHDIYLGSGATDLIKALLTVFTEDVDGKPSGVMIPIPQYPLFSGALAELGLAQVEYYLDEERGWALDVAELRRALRNASATCRVRVLVVINPGNPTGQVLTRENMEEVVRFAHEHRLFLLADEVYQENIIAKPFHSFKKVMYEMGAPYCDMELGSVLTCSKGWAAECGLRAGLLELVRVHPGVVAAFCTARALMQCPTVLGQAALLCVMKPPTPGDASYEQFAMERREIRRVLRERAATAHRAFNSIPGYSCNAIDGSMFAFPRFEIPERAQRAARAQGIEPDEFYCLRLLEETGVCVVPGSGFGQRPGTYHLRTTILHSRSQLQHMMDSVRRFHAHFLHQYADTRLDCTTDTSTGC
ncbi:alanine aminotransferase 1 [Papilio machaon]|uniref:alanine aminotransferase 1 n=1 Tax=Papilio machaon TaxID=76193 RepID=UPI001E663584|nr:alanine aminotransferase 1 [Papilio machaon]